MKRCPTCERTFDDSLKFCQIDGSPLVAASEPEDLMKTMVSSPTDMPAPDFDSFKTIVGNPISADEGVNQREVPDDAEKTQILSREEMEKEMGSGEMNSEMAKGVSPPSPFGGSNPSWMDSQEKGSDDFAQTPPPFDETQSSSYRSPSSSFQESEPMFGNPQESFNQSPFGNQAESHNSPRQQSEWTPPPAPMSEWQNQNIGANTPFQTGVMTKGQDKTLAIVSLVCGILSLTCCGPVTGIAALITGYMAKNNIDADPLHYTGRGLAVAGMIMGGISLVLTVLWFVFAGIGSIFR